MLSELKKFKIQTILVLEYKKRNDHKIFHSSFKLIAEDSDIDEAFISMHQSIMKKVKNYASEDWIVLYPKKRCQPMKSETLSLKNIINELDFLRKTIVIQCKIRKRKDLQMERWPSG